MKKWTLAVSYFLHVMAVVILTLALAGCATKPKADAPEHPNTETHADHPEGEHPEGAAADHPAEAPAEQPAEAPAEQPAEHPTEHPE